MKHKVAYKGDGTKETGKKIIAELARLGGYNFLNCGGHSSFYYIINETNNRIVRVAGLPETHTLISLEPKQKLFRLL